MKKPVAAVVAVCAITVALVWWAIPDDSQPEWVKTTASDRTPSLLAPERASAVTAPAKGEPPAPGADPRSEREVAQLRLQRAEHTLREYRAATRYPPESRPAREHPDAMEPPAPERQLPFEENESGDSALYLVAKQDRVFLSSEEAVTLTLRCVNRRGEPQRCEVPPGSAMEPQREEGLAPLAPVPVPFRDEGGDGVFTARFSPSQAGFPSTGGTIRIAVSASAGSARRDAFFDLLYTGQPPAKFTGRVTDKIEGGSLIFDVGLEVKTPGRYVITGRVDDAEGRPFAWLQFNEELPAGARQARLRVFGKLIVDERPAFPLRLRDVEGFLLKEYGDPDRELMTTLAGPVHTTKAHALQSFSDAEWSSEQRARYLAELEKDVREAEEDVAAASSP